MKRLSDLPDDEISQYMDFDGLLTKQKAIVKTKMYWKWGVFGSAVVLILVALLYTQTEHSLQPKTLQRIEPATSLPMITDSVIANETKARHQPAKDILREEPQRAEGKQDSIAISREQLTTNPVYMQAEPVNGYPALYEYFNSTLVYPAEVKQDSIQGVLTVTFVINAAGKPENITVQNSLGEAFEREAIRLIEHMPAWKPASLNSKPVASKLSLPLTFRIE